MADAKARWAAIKQASDQVRAGQPFMRRAPASKVATIVHAARSESQAAPRLIPKGNAYLSRARSTPGYPK